MDASLKNRWLHRLTKVLASVQLGLAGGGLLFRSTWYPHLPVAPGDPYGLGDIIELLIYLALVGTSLFTLLVALVCIARPAWRDRLCITILLWAALLPLPAYYLLHTHVPRLW